MAETHKEIIRWLELEDMPKTAELEELCFPSAWTAEQFAEAFGGADLYDDLERMAQSDIDAVYIASPNSLHYSQSKLFLEHGKHVFCEKPLTVMPWEAAGLAALARERGLSFSFGTCVLRDVHPNSALIRLEDAGGGQLEVGASSPGGGRIRVFQVDGLHTSFSGELPITAALAE